MVRRPSGYTPRYDERGNNPASLIERGEALFNDASLSTNGLSCASCHGAKGDAGFQTSFQQPFPHPVAMGTNMFGMETVHADEMVQLCMVAPMAADPLPWDSEELAALAAYVVHAQQRFTGEVDGHCNR
ncbi:c-type cytochrome [Vreelandella piezotolerans]|nr:c-type cytochrome [Halomonas piezotolerans]